MMKIYAIIISLLLIFVACQQKPTEQKSEPQNQSWKIKVCKMYQSDFVILDPNDKGQLIQEFRFNKSGYVNELIRYGMDGEIIGKFDIYGQNTPFPMPDNPIYVDTVLVVFDFDTAGMVKGKEVKIYNNQGLLTAAEFYESREKLVRKNTYVYDSKNMIKEDIYWDIELDKPKEKIRYEFEYFDN